MGELREYLAVIWKWLWLILLSTAAAALGSWYMVKDQPPIYQTHTTVMIGQAIEKRDPTYFDFDISEQLGQTYTELIKLEPILRATARALGFEEQWTRLRGQVNVELVHGTLLIRVRATDSDPLRAKMIADETARQLQAAVGTSGPQDDRTRFIEEQAATFPPKIAAAQQEISNLEAQMQEAFGARQIQDIENQISTLERQIFDWQNTFASYQLLLGEGSVNVLEIVEEARVPTFPIGPNSSRQVVLAAAIGGLLAVGAAFLIEYLDDTLRTPEALAKATGLTTLGVIARIAGDHPNQMLVTDRHPKSPISEAYRAMRTNLQFTSLDRPLRSLVVTSPGPGEGKSTTLANLGVVFAQAGSTVVLVDSDLRRPALHKILQMPNREGLTTVLLEGETALDRCLRKTGIPNLRLLTSGPLPPNPSELLGSQRMQHILELLLAEADVILFDSPPTLPVTDATVLGKQVDGVVLITDAARTRRELARRAAEGLGQVGVTLLGAALNRTTARDAGEYYYYYYYSGGEKGRRARRRVRWPWKSRRREQAWRGTTAAQPNPAAPKERYR